MPADEETLQDLLKSDSFALEDVSPTDILEESNDSRRGRNTNVQGFKNEGVRATLDTSQQRMQVDSANDSRAKQDTGSGYGARPSMNRKSGTAGSRYFIMKSFNHDNIAQSIEKGVWATQKHNEEKLNEAFQNTANVYLIFSVNSSGHFQGYARMMSPVTHKQAQWEGSTATLGSTFNIQWKRLVDLPFSATETLRNPLNENKPVKVARDGQEVASEVGQKLCMLFEEEADQQGVPRPQQPMRGQQAPSQPPFHVGMHGRPQPPPPLRPGMGMDMGMGMMPPPGMMMPGMAAAMGPGMGMPMGMMPGPGMVPHGMGPSMGPGMGMPPVFGEGGPMMGDLAMQQREMLARSMMGSGRPGMLMQQSLDGRGPGGWPGQMGPKPPKGPPPPDASRPSSTGLLFPDASLEGRRVPGMGMQPGVPMNGRQYGSGMDWQQQLSGIRDRDMMQSMGGDRDRDRYGDRDRHDHYTSSSRPSGRSSPGAGRSRRSRTRSPTPERSRRRHRSRSRSRSRSPSRKSKRPNFLEMSYDDYVDYFEKVQKQMEAAKLVQMNPMLAMNMGMNPLLGLPSSSGNMMPSLGQTMATPQGQTMPSEAEYVQFCERYAKNMGLPFNAEDVRRYYAALQKAKGGYRG